MIITSRYVPADVAQLPGTAREQQLTQHALAVQVIGSGVGAVAQQPALRLGDNQSLLEQPADLLVARHDHLGIVVRLRVEGEKHRRARDLGQVAPP